VCDVTGNQGFPWPDGKRAAAAITVDFDAESAMLFENPASVDYLNLMSLQWYGPRVGIFRILHLLEARGVRGTFFVPGFTVDRWTDAVRRVHAEGHELGHHGYLHEPLYDLDDRTEEEYLTRGLEAFTKAGLPAPRGFRAPKFRLTFKTPALLARHGFRYDSSLMDSDHPYALAVGPPAPVATIIELPVCWPLDDWAYYGFAPGFTPVSTIHRPESVLAAWVEELDAIADVGGCFVLTIHPFLSGRPARIRALDRLIAHIQAREDIWLTTLGEIADHTASLELDPVVNVAPVHPYPDRLETARPATFQ
jgi:peptidoglycan/xylan/chitin deacetylase (PgdA/CDA1 family)